MAKTINNRAELINILSQAKCGGQFVCIIGETEIKCNKFPTDGSERIRIKDNFHPTHKYQAKFHFGADYEKAMSKALGEDYTKKADPNRRTILANVLMEYVSTGNMCLIYMPCEKIKQMGEFVNGEVASAEDMEYINRYRSPKSQSVLLYNTISVKNIKEIHIDNEVYVLDLNESIAYKQVV